MVPAGTYQINVVATQADTTGSPLTQPQTITGTDSPLPPFPLVLPMMVPAAHQRVLHNIQIF